MVSLIWVGLGGLPTGSWGGGACGCFVRSSTLTSKVALAKPSEKRAWIALMKWLSWTAWWPRRAWLDLRELEEKLVFLSLWLALDSSAMTSDQRPVKSPSNQHFGQSLIILKVFCQEKYLPEWLTKMHLASIMNLRQEFMSEGDDKIEFNSVVTKPDHMSRAPLGTCWSMKTRVREIEWEIGG